MTHLTDRFSSLGRSGARRRATPRQAAPRQAICAASDGSCSLGGGFPGTGPAVARGGHQIPGSWRRLPDGRPSLGPRRAYPENHLWPSNGSLLFTLGIAAFDASPSLRPDSTASASRRCARVSPRAAESHTSPLVSAPPPSRRIGLRGRLCHSTGRCRDGGRANNKEAPGDVAWIYRHHDRRVPYGVYRN